MNIGKMHIESVVENGLCTGCGICTGLCKNKILKIKDGKCILTDEKKCINCELCKKCCPSYGYTLNNLYRNFYGIYEASSNNKKLIKNCTSGGAITQLLSNAIQFGFADKVAVVNRNDSINGELCNYNVTDSIDEILMASGSNYVMASIEQVISEIRESNNRYVIVGTPCVLYGITQAMKYDIKLKSNIVLKIGFICGYTYENKCIEGLTCYSHNKLSDVKRLIGWREDGFPGFTVLEKYNGEKVKIPFTYEHSIDVTFYAHKKCLLCKDCFCDYGDIVAGDIGRGWNDKKTLLLTRSDNGKNFLKQYGQYIKLRKLRQEDLKMTPLDFMEIEKRSKVSERLKVSSENLPEWKGDYNERNLFPIRKQVVKYLNRYQRNIRTKKEKFLLKPSKMLRAGMKVYGGIENKKIFQYIFLAERVCQYAKEVKWFKFLTLHMAKIGRQKHFKNALNVCVIGLGAWGRQYIDLLFNNPKYNLIAIYDKNLELCNNVAKRYKVDIQTVDEMMYDERIDTVFVLTPNHMHEEIIIKALECGKNVFVEKPLTNDLVSTQRIIRKVKDANKKLYVAHSMKCGKGFQILKKMLENMELGDIRQFSCVRSLHGMGVDTRLSWRSDAGLAPMLPMIQLGIHLIDACIFLFGNVKCLKTTIHNTCGLTDSVGCLLNAGEIQGSLLTCYDTENSYEFVIYGSKGKAVLTDKKLTIFENSREKVITKGLDKENLLEFELEDYWQWRLNNQPPVNTTSRALQTIQLFDDICRKGEVIDNDS